MLAAGRLDRFVSIMQAPNGDQRDALNAPTGEPVLFAKVWAQKLPREQSEHFQGDQYASTVSTVWTIRYLDGLDPRMFIVEANGQTHAITGMLELGRAEGWAVGTWSRQEARAS